MPTDKIEKLKERLIRLAKIEKFGNIGITREISDLVDKVNNIKKEFIDKVDESQKELERLINEVADKIQFIKLKKGEQGERGIPGKDGKTPIAGIDFPLPKNGQDGRDGKDGISPGLSDIAVLSSKLAITEVLKQIPTIEAIENDLPKLGANIASALELLPEGEKLKLEAIEGLRKELDKLKKIKGGYGGGGGNRWLDSLLNVYTDGKVDGSILVWDATNGYWTIGSLNDYVPYSGAINNVDLGDYSLTSTDIISRRNATIQSGYKLIFDGHY